MTTKARLIENVIAEFLRDDGWRIDAETGDAEIETASDMFIVSVPNLAAAIMD